MLKTEKHEVDRKNLFYKFERGAEPEETTRDICALKGEKCIGEYTEWKSFNSSKNANSSLSNFGQFTRRGLC